MQLAFAKACKRRTEYNRTLGEVRNMMNLIDEEDVYAWARNEQNRGQLEKMHDSCLETLSLLGRRFLREDPNAWRRSIKAEATVISELESFSDQESHFDQLAERCEVLQKKHNAGVEAGNKRARNR